MCWHCDSLHDPKCVDPFDNHTMPMKDCKQETLETYLGVKSTMCRKIRQKGICNNDHGVHCRVFNQRANLFIVYGKWRFYRSCAFLGEPGIGGDERYCLMRTGTHNIFTEYCTCNSRDGCNGTSGISYSVLNFILAPILFIYGRLLYCVHC